MGKSKDAKSLKEYNISDYTKGFVATSVLNGIITTDYFQYRNIYNIIHHSGIGVEIICYNGTRRIFYHNTVGDSQILFDLINTRMSTWVGSNLN